ncbi:hypothetical protein FBQ97_14045 [Acidobacteria bacterium ACD]|nr:MAG: hypothetical protein EDX89_11120 [Acidobacteriota bacterium]MDL1950917.1 hypothetical protein [Acidobacteria bacterium ACD]
MIRTLRTAALAAACVFLVSCSADKTPADAAIKSAEQTIAAAAPEAEKFVPDLLKSAQADLQAAKDLFAKGDYKGALAAGQALATKAGELASAANAKKAELTALWEETSGSVPKMVEAIKSRVDVLGQAKKLPKGMDADKLTQAKDGLAAMTSSWDAASAAFGAGNLIEAVEKSKGLKEKGTEILTLLGMAPAEPAAAPAAAPPAEPAK